MFGKKNSRNDYDYTSLLVRNTELESTISDFKSRLHEVAKERSALSEENAQLKAELEAYKKNAMPGTAPADTNSNAELAALRKELNWLNGHAKDLENALYNERAENAELKEKLNNGGNRMSNEVTQWEYKQILAPDDDDFDIDTLNKLGKEGWEATGNTQTRNGYTKGLLLKRPKQKDDDYGYSR